MSNLEKVNKSRLDWYAVVLFVTSFWLSGLFKDVHLLRLLLVDDKVMVHGIHEDAWLVHGLAHVWRGAHVGALGVVPRGCWDLLAALQTQQLQHQYHYIAGSYYFLYKMGGTTLLVFGVLMFLISQNNGEVLFKGGLTLMSEHVILSCASAIHAVY